MLPKKARFFVNDTVYKELSGSDFYQISDASTNNWIFLKADKDCSVIRCGKNLMFPIGEMPKIFNKDTEKGHHILRCYSVELYRKILQYPRTYSMRITENSIENNGYFQFQENTKEYMTGLLRIRKSNNGTVKAYISDTVSTYPSSGYYGSYYFANMFNIGTASIKADQYMCALGDDDVYEPYTAQVKTLSAGETIAVSALDGINTLFCSNGTLTVRYVQKKAEGNL